MDRAPGLWRESSGGEGEVRACEGVARYRCIGEKAWGLPRKESRVEDAAREAWFRPDQSRSLGDFWTKLEEHVELVRDETVRRLAAQAEFGPAFAIPDVDAGARFDRFLHAWGRRDSENWADIDVILGECRSFFAERGVGIAGWSDACAVVEAELTKVLITGYASDPTRLAGTLAVLQRYATRTISTIARQFLSIGEQLLAAERQQTAQALTRFTRLAESGVLGVIVCDFLGNILEANEGFLEKFGYTREELLSGDVRWAGMTPPEWEHLDESAIAQLRASGKTRPWEKEYFHKDGSRIPVLVGVASLNESQTIAFVLDISERKRLEEVRARSAELEAQSRRIQEASRLKSEFLANMSHELRTPLNSIIGFSELLRDREIDPASPQYLEFLEDILTSARHLRQLIDDVLDLAKVEAGKIELRPEKVNLERLVSEVATVLRSVAASRRIQIATEIAPEVRIATLDPGRFKQILYNYLSNALKFTPAGGKVKVHALAEDLDRFRVVIEDTGIGIAPEDLGRLFVEFQQLEAGATKKHGGTGLGLALTKRLVEAQGGSVGVKSVLGHGSQFFAILPLHASEVPEARPDLPSEYPPNTGHASVLVVEDDARDRALLMQALTRAGYGVETAPSGEKAIASCARRAFDAITLDLLLPDMTGLDVLHRIRLEGKNQQTPVIVVSVVAEQGIVAGFSVQDYLIKPVDGRELISALRKACVHHDRGGKLLIVDDDPAAHRLMTATLEQLGYEIRCCSSGEEALDWAARERPLAVILDLLMPGIDGFEFLHRFRDVSENRSTPVIVWTMKDLTPEDHRQLHRLAQRVITKNDWSPTSFLRELRSLISREGAEGTGAPR